MWAGSLPSSGSTPGSCGGTDPKAEREEHRPFLSSSPPCWKMAAGPVKTDGRTDRGRNWESPSGGLDSQLFCAGPRPLRDSDRSPGQLHMKMESQASPPKQSLHACITTHLPGSPGGERRTRQAFPPDKYACAGAGEHCTHWKEIFGA